MRTDASAVNAGNQHADSYAGAVALQCACGRALAMSGDSIVCVCGRHLGARGSGVWRVGQPAAYWGELLSEQLEDLLAMSRRLGWRRAVEKLTPELTGYLADPRRATFMDILPALPGSRILELGAGLGAIASALAREFDVTALEGVELRAEFMALRAAQDGLERLRVICADWHRIRFAPRQFHAIILNGVLEWAAIGDRVGSPRQAQIRFLRRVRDWLAPRGTIYLAIENRFGWPELRGAVDHSGLPYTSLLPRWLAQWICGLWSPYRSSTNRGYRTYTYSHAGYRRLVREAGLAVRQTYICPLGYNLPLDLMPLHAGALRFQKANRQRAASWRLAAWRSQLAWPWLYRLAGGDFAFFLTQAEARTPTAGFPWQDSDGA
ncbi:MAG: class I SAM-dependent methyltransferase [Terriglobales bacterium]